MRYEGVVFDLDHTLFDRYETLRALSKEFCDKFEGWLAKGVTAEKMASLLCEGDTNYIYHGWKRVFQFLCESGAFDPIPEYEMYRQALLDLFTKYAVPYSFTYSVLDELKARGLKIGLITNGNGDIQAKKVELLGLTDAFDCAILCGHFGVQKPDRAPFDEMARRLSIPAEKLLYVGDNPKCDVDASRNAGYTPVEVLTAKCVLPEFAPAEHRIASVAKLPELIDRLQNA